MRKFQVPNYNSIVLVGSGGTGGFIVPHLIRMVCHMVNSSARPEITIIDPDIVEPKNCNRQNFVYSDVEKHKAMVHAQRYSAAFGIPVSYRTDRLTFDNFRELADSNGGKTLIIDAVDKIRPRRHIWKYVRGNVRVDWLSLGNTDKNGQAILYSKDMFGNDARSLITVFENDFNKEAEQAEIAADRARSCADNAVSQPQTIAINLTSANVAVNFLYQLLYDREISHDIVFFDRFNNMRSIMVGAPVEETVSNDIAARMAAKLGGTMTGTTNPTEHPTQQAVPIMATAEGRARSFQTRYPWDRNDAARARFDLETMRATGDSYAQQVRQQQMYMMSRGNYSTYVPGSMEPADQIAGREVILPAPTVENCESLDRLLTNLNNSGYRTAPESVLEQNLVPLTEQELTEYGESLLRGSTPSTEISTNSDGVMCRVVPAVNAAPVAYMDSEMGIETMGVDWAVDVNIAQPDTIITNH